MGIKILCLANSAHGYVYAMGPFLGRKLRKLIKAALLNSKIYDRKKILREHILEDGCKIKKVRG